MSPDKRRLSAIRIIMAAFALGIAAIGMCQYFSSGVGGGGAGEEPGVQPPARVKNAPAGWLGEGVMQTKETYYYGDDGELTRITRTRYDESGHLIFDAEYNQFRKCVRESAWVYGDNDIVTEKTYTRYGETYAHYEELYDEWGNMVSQYRYNADGSLLGKELYERQYDEEGNIFAENMLYINSRGKQSLREERLYDEKGELIGLHEYWDGLLVRQMESEYDENGELRRSWWGYYQDFLKRTPLNIDGDIEVLDYYSDGKKEYSVYAYNEDGELELQWKTFYDTEGNEQCYYYNGDGDVVWHTETQYNAEGQERLYCEYDAGDSIEYGYRIEYADCGNPAAFYEYEDGDWRLSVSYEYTEEGWDKARYSYESDGETLEQTELWAYNENGDTILETVIGESGLIYRDEWTYDERGNKTSYRYYTDNMVLHRAYDWEYDEYNHLIWERECSGSDESITTYTYIYHEAAGTVTIYKRVDGAVRQKQIIRYYSKEALQSALP